MHSIIFDKRMKTVTINKKRIDYLLSLFNMTKDELLVSISKGLKKSIAWSDIYRDAIDINYLKRIDNVFNKGLYYYADPTVPTKDKGVSVFFRKESFGAELNLGARKRVLEFENLTSHLLAISALSDIPIVNKLPRLTIQTNPKEAAFSLRNAILPTFMDDKRTFLKNYINKLGDLNVIVFEFVDTFNKKEKANIDGFHLRPNIIVLKRRQDSLSREIFTLSHELAHCLLGVEEIEEVDILTSSDQNNSLSDVEKWCNTFAYYLLLGTENAALLESVRVFDSKNDYGHDLVKQISSKTHLSRLAIFTHLLLQDKLSFTAYSDIKNDLESQWKIRELEKQKKKEMDLASGKFQRGSTPKPIKSDIVRDIYNIALNSGVIGEQEYCQGLSIRPSQVESFRYL